MNAKAIETLSINAVRDSIVVTDFLDQFIQDNDKEPSWDGSVYIYKDKSKKKNKLIGRVPVQVKGKQSNYFEANEISYSVEVADLNNYLYDGGTIFFVVYVSEHADSKIYYCELTPIKLRLYIAKAKKQETEAIKLKPFPTENSKKATLFNNFYQNSRKQASFADTKLLSLEELESEGVLEGISCTVSGYDLDMNDPPRIFVTNEVYMYAKIKGSSILQPLEVIPVEMRTSQEINNPVLVNDKLFYTYYNRICSKESDTYVIGESFKLTFKRDKNISTIKYTTAKTLRQRIKDLDFMISALEAKSFSFGTATLPLDPPKEEMKSFDLPREKENLAYYKKMVIVLDVLNVNEDLDLDSMTPDDIRNYNRLITAFVDKQPVSGLKPDLQEILSMNISNLRFILAFIPVKDEIGTYNIYDFFRTKLQLACECVDKKMHPISQYAILRTDDYISTSNIRYEVILPSYKEMEESSLAIERGNWALLDMLTAYDKSQKQEILSTAKEFSEWLLNEADDVTLDKQVRMLNYLQVIKRERDFNIDEVKSLYSITENSDSREDILVGAYLLLGIQAASEIHFAKIDEETKKNFISYPIYKFWNSTK